MFFYSFGNEGYAEPANFVIIVGATVAGEFDGGAHLFEDPEVVVEATFGDADLVGAVGGGAGGFQGDKIVEADEPVQ